jgi:hypothetical protein
MELQQPNEETLVQNATDSLNSMDPTADRGRVERRVREIVHDLCAHSRVKNFIGVIAERRARDELRKSMTVRS